MVIAGTFITRDLFRIQFCLCFYLSLKKLAAKTFHGQQANDPAIDLLLLFQGKFGVKESFLFFFTGSKSQGFPISRVNEKKFQRWKKTYPSKPPTV